MSEVHVPYGSLPQEGLIDELTASIDYNAQEDCLTMTFQVFPKMGYCEPTIRLLTGLFPGILEQIRAIDTGGWQTVSPGYAGSSLEGEPPAPQS